MRLTFSKDERLKSKKLIDELFREKAFVQNSVLRIYYKKVVMDCAFQAQFAFTAPKKLFSNAVDRNRIKRLMRESVRLQKPNFYTLLQDLPADKHGKDSQLILLLSYHAKEIKNFSEIDEAVTKLLKKITGELH